MGLAIVITSGKGGVGKSTVTLGLGRAFAEKGRRVLLVDCDAGLRSLDRMTGTEKKLIFDISDIVFGRCEPIEAMYECEDTEGLFLLPAPTLDKDSIKPAVMEKLVPILKTYFDYVLLDSPAGIGTGFKAACCAADIALIVCTPDSVSVRGAEIVKPLLEKMEISDIKLIINRFSKELFEREENFNDLDAVIDLVGVRLIGVLPEDIPMSAAFLNGKKASSKFEGTMALSRIAARMEGQDVPITGF